MNATKIWTMAWPIALAVLSNVIYHICSKSMPENLNPFAGLTVTYLTGAVVSALLYVILGKDISLSREISNLSWAPFVLGVIIVGLEVGFLYAYKNGWQVSTASVVQSTFLAVLLLFVGIVFKEKLTPNKLAGMGVCLIGLYLINR